MLPVAIDEKAVFNIARRIESREARADYLNQVCTAHPEVFRHVLELLQVHDQQQSFLEVPAAGAIVTVAEAPLERPGTVIGPIS